MMMKYRIEHAYPHAMANVCHAGTLYVADFTERTQSVRGVEIHETAPLTPDSAKDMDCFVMQNPKGIGIQYNIFDGSQFKDAEGKEVQHCECCLFPETETDGAWVVFLEIKDCKPKNISEHKDKAKEQIVSSVNWFRNKGVVVSGQNIYGILSFPRKGKLAFNQTIFEDHTEYKRLYKQHKIHFYATNEVSAKNEKSVIPV